MSSLEEDESERRPAWKFKNPAASPEIKGARPEVDSVRVRNQFPAPTPAADYLVTARPSNRLLHRCGASPSNPFRGWMSILGGLFFVAFYFFFHAHAFATRPQNLIHAVLAFLIAFVFKVFFRKLALMSVWATII